MSSCPFLGKEAKAMVVTEIKDQILADLNRLSPGQQRHAAELVHRLLGETPQGVPGRDLLRFSGWLDDTSASEMMAAIEEGCEQVDPDGW